MAVREGRVEVCFSKTWGSICPFFYDSEDANVICRQINESVGILGPGDNTFTVCVQYLVSLLDYSNTQ